jgi:hypothetical protein
MDVENFEDMGAPKAVGGVIEEAVAGPPLDQLAEGTGLKHRVQFGKGPERHNTVLDPGPIGEVVAALLTGGLVAV